MAGDWIKMRSNLWDDPRVAKICDMTDQSEATIVGGLYWLWSTADQHSTDGEMTGMTLRAIDRKTGIPGFGAAIVAAGWMTESAEGVQIVRFDEHNGKSAKRRCAESVRKMSARHADKNKTECVQHEDCEQQSCAPREREREDISTTDVVDKRRATRFDAQAHLVSIGVDATIAADWLQHRKAKKATVTLTVIDGIKGEAAKARISLSDALAMCCQRGWTGFKAEWMRDSDQDHGARNQQPARPTIHDERAYTAAALTGKIPARTTFEEFMAAKIPAASAGMKLIEGEVIHAA